MRGVPPVFAAVKQLYLLAWDYGVMLEFVWVPRSHEKLQYADYLSKRADATDWCFSRQFALHLVFDRLQRTPDIDCLASHAAHICDTYFSAIYDGQCVAVDGFRQHWARWPTPVLPPFPAKPLCWVFPPLSLAPQATRKVYYDRADAILVLPRTPPAPVARLLTAIGAQAAVTHRIMLTGPHARMVFPSPLVPPRAADGGWKTPLMAFVVFWPDPTA